MEGLRRKAYDRLLEWKESDGETAILITGARRVGKTYLASEFAINEYLDHLIVDFSDMDPFVEEAFDRYNGDVDDFLQDLSVAIGHVLPVRASVIVFDNVQLRPRARQMIKYLVADGRYDYMEVGTLVATSSRDIVIPSEEEDLQLMPLDFEEFLWALGDDTLMDRIRECLDGNIRLDDETHRTAMSLFRRYMVVGGMPESV